MQVLPPALFKTKLFEGLDQAELKALVNKGDLKSFAEGSTILKENDTGDEFYCIVLGAAAVQVTNQEGANVTLKTLSEADVLGEMILLKKNKRTASVVALENSELLTWNYKACLDLFASNPLLGYKIMRNLAMLVSDKLSDMNALYRDK